MPVSIKHVLNPKILKAILAKWSDGLYYKVKVLECNQEKRECLVHFEDDTKSWMKASDLHAQLIEDLEEDLIACCICDEGFSKAPNLLIICDLCDQGYHMQCHKPIANEEDADEDKQWYCSTCVAITNPKQEQQSSPDVQPKLKKARVDTPAKKTSSLPAVKSCRRTNSSSTKKAETPKKATTPRRKAQPIVQTPEPVGEEVVIAEEPEKKTDVEHMNYKIPKISREPVKTKAERKDMSQVEDAPSHTVSSNAPHSPIMDDNKTIEEMDPDLIEAAKNVVVNGFETKEFMGIVTISNETKVLAEVKPNKRSRKQNGRTAAA